MTLKRTVARAAPRLLAPVPVPVPMLPCAGLAAQSLRPAFTYHGIAGKQAVQRSGLLV